MLRNRRCIRIVFLGQHSTFRQEVSDRIFVPIQSSGNGGILYVFPISGTAEVGQKGAITAKIITETAKGEKGGEEHGCEELCWI